MQTGFIVICAYDAQCVLFEKVLSKLSFSFTTTTTAHLMALFLGLPRWASTRKVKPIWILLKQETVSGSGIIWAMCKSASRFRLRTMPAPHHSVFCRPDALPATQPTAPKHWRHCFSFNTTLISCSGCCTVVFMLIDICLQCFDAVGWVAGRASGL